MDSVSNEPKAIPKGNTEETSMAKIRFILEVEADKPNEYDGGLTPAERWLNNRDMLWMVHGQGQSPLDEAITLIEREGI